MAKKLIIALLMLIVASPLLVFLPVFRIKSLEINENHCVSKDEILKKNKITGKSIVIFSAQNLENDLKNQFSCIKEVTVKKKFPSTLVITSQISEFLVKIESTSFALTQSGLVVEPVGQLPTAINIPQAATLSLGAELKDKKTLKALELASKLSRTDFSAASIRIVEDDLVVYPSQDFAVTFTAKKDLDNQIDSLQQVLARSKIDATKIAKIDLRFDRPVIVYK